MSDCTHDCSTCGESCADRKNESPFQIKPLREGCRVGKVYGVVSGKGGVGKSMVTSQLAVSVRREGYNVAVLDADITGPSIPKAFGIHGRAMAHGDAIVPVTTATGIQLMSVNLLLEHETDPVIWRGPVIGGVVQQFWGRHPVERRGLYVRGHAPRHRRRGPQRVPDPAGGRRHHRGVAAGPGVHGGAEGRKDGPDDAHSHRGSGGEHELRAVSRLRQKALYFRRGARRRRPPRSTACPCWPRCPSTRSWPS